VTLLQPGASELLPSGTPPARGPLSGNAGDLIAAALPLSIRLSARGLALLLTFGPKFGVTMPKLTAPAEARRPGRRVRRAGRLQPPLAEWQACCRLGGRMLALPRSSSSHRQRRVTRVAGHAGPSAHAAASGAAAHSAALRLRVAGVKTLGRADGRASILFSEHFSSISGHHSVSRATEGQRGHLAKPPSFEPSGYRGRDPYEFRQFSLWLRQDSLFRS
jgi:hypothetical protein